VICDPFEILIASPSDRENLVAEIYFENQQVAEIWYEVSSKLSVDLFPKPDGGPWSFDLTAFRGVLEAAAVHLCPDKQG